MIHPAKEMEAVTVVGNKMHIPTHVHVQVHDQQVGNVQYI